MKLYSFLFRQHVQHNDLHKKTNWKYSSAVWALQGSTCHKILLAKYSAYLCFITKTICSTNRPSVFNHLIIAAVGVSGEYDNRHISFNL